MSAVETLVMASLTACSRFVCVCAPLAGGRRRSAAEHI
jgi:hypothetical protein